MAEGTIPDNPEIDLHLNVVDTTDGFEALRASWRELADRVPVTSVFQTFEWNYCWWRAFGKHDRLFIVTCHRDEALVGIAPLTVTRGRFSTVLPRTEIRFIGCRNYASDYLDFIIDPDTPTALEAILLEVVRNLKDVNRLRISHLPTHFANHPRIHEFLTKNQLRFTRETEHKAPYRLLGDAVEDTRAANKSTVRRRYNYFRKLGDLEFQKCTDTDEIQGQMGEFFDQHIARRELTRVASQFLDSQQKNFYRLLVTELQPTGWLRFDSLNLDARPLAFHFGFEFRNNFIWYKPTFDVAYYKHSPGQVLIKFLMEDSINRGLSEFDFTIGSEPFKYRFANAERYNDRFIVFKSSFDYWSHRVTILLLKISERFGNLRARLKGCD